MDFSFDATAGASQSTIRPKLAGNSIYSVRFDGAEKKDIQGVKDPTITYEVLILKFSNEDGIYEHTIFGPKPEDGKRGETEFTNKNGNKEKIPQPSNNENLMLLLKHVIDAVNPTVAKVIDSGEKKLGAKDWVSLRELVLKICTQGVGAQTKIKLLKKKSNGEATFPGFFAAINRDGKAYIRNNFIGDKVAFSAYEITRITNEANATPSNSTDLGLNLGNDLPANNLDLNFSIDDL